MVDDQGEPTQSSEAGAPTEQVAATEPPAAPTATADAPPPVDGPPGDTTTAAPSRRGGMSRGATIGIAIVALLIGGIVGVAIGWKAEQQRVKSDVANIRPVARVTGVSGDKVTVKFISTSGTRTYQLSDATLIDPTQKGDRSDITKRARVIVKGTKKNGQWQATEIVVLPENTKIGKH